MLDIMGVEDLAAVPGLEPYAFERVFVLAYTGAYEWRRRAGWRKLGGESGEGQRTSSFEGTQASPLSPLILWVSIACVQGAAREVIE